MFAAPLFLLFTAQSWFTPALLQKPEIRKALASIDERQTPIIDEWIRLTEILAPSNKGLGGFKLPVINVGMLGGGTVVNAVPREAWFTVDLRSLDSAVQGRLDTAVAAAAKRAGEQEGVGFRLERKMAIDYSKAKPQLERLNHPVVQTALAT